MRRQSTVIVAALITVLTDASAHAQSVSAGGAAPAGVWSARLSLATYVLPEDDDYVQPTAAVDRGRLHLETRYNYEDRQSVSFFGGWNLAFGGAIKLRLTPMFGAVAGDTDGLIPALEAGLTWRWLDLYSEGEYVFDLNQQGSRFFYNWFEGSVWPTDWLRVGMVTQRTHVYQSPRELQRGVLIGAAISRIEPTFYLFNPGADDYLFVAAIGIELLGAGR